MTTTFEVGITCARYLGMGCFIRADGYLAFVNIHNRVPWLVEGKCYAIAMQMDGLYYVKGVLP